MGLGSKKFENHCSTGFCRVLHGYGIQTRIECGARYINKIMLRVSLAISHDEIPLEWSRFSSYIYLYFSSNCSMFWHYISARTQGYEPQNLFRNLLKWIRFAFNTVVLGQNVVAEKVWNFWGYAHVWILRADLAWGQQGWVVYGRNLVYLKQKHLCVHAHMCFCSSTGEYIYFTVEHGTL